MFMEGDKLHDFQLRKKRSSLFDAIFVRTGRSTLIKEEFGGLRLDDFVSNWDACLTFCFWLLVLPSSM